MVILVTGSYLGEMAEAIRTRPLHVVVLAYMRG